MSATDRIYTADEEQQVCFAIEVRVPFGQAARFAEHLTGDDNDVILAAEQAMRKRIDGMGDLEAVELWPAADERAIRRALLHAALQNA